MVVNNIQGYLQSRIVFFLMNIHNRHRTIYLVRAGEALVEHLYKADADLSSLGWDYADEMAQFMVNLRRKKAGLPPIEPASSSTTAAAAVKARHRVRLILWNKTAKRSKCGLPNVADPPHRIPAR